MSKLGFLELGLWPSYGGLSVVPVSLGEGHSLIEVHDLGVECSQMQLPPEIVRARDFLLNPFADPEVVFLAKILEWFVSFSCFLDLFGFFLLLLLRFKDGRDCENKEKMGKWKWNMYLDAGRGLSCVFGQFGLLWEQFKRYSCKNQRKGQVFCLLERNAINHIVQQMPHTNLLFERLSKERLE